ncbi:hypothetical protein BA895_09455 [Humibacillus sp. DSM 29435]|uniref:bifunctional glycosyltransferase/CDP-glycerol:glycerophosphate glycerophosphotransferase n=1 Tax=Humibacillus sp. DSM 29435 TaxID=1869167 RepID=UPI0008734195|nr:CDP-glycerol glycerophosphotransferase family protein [Humibacillus sp. DSM 29435]OFE14575.1 hypothetical protein BA895_09455 [Humibacillus sp. DSM 29435]
MTTTSPTVKLPDVSVIVICYNDAANLPTAVASVLRQSLRNVEVIISDDCSTDETQEVAKALVDSDPRVRYHRLAQNSGGCGAPRNEGISLSSAPYVMFLDSDDELERHACYNLVTTARAHDSEVVSGKCKRHYVATDKWTTWYAPLYRERRLLGSAEEMPGIVFDSISTNKLYRREFLDRHELRFPVGVKYEDLQFTANVYAKAERLAVIPETVYHWRIYTTVMRTTITHQRSEVNNLRDRLKAIEVAAKVFDQNDKPKLRHELYVKFLRHDARISIEDVGDSVEPEFQAQILALLDPALRAVPRHYFDGLEAMERVALGMALCRSAEGIRQAKKFARHKGAQAGRLVSSGDRVLWSPVGDWTPPPTGSLEESLTDLTDNPILETPAASIRLYHNITAATPLPKGVRICGETHDTFGKFAQGPAHPTMDLRIALRGGTTTQVVPVTVTSVDAEVIRWTLDLLDFSERNNQHGTRWWLSVRTVQQGRVNDSLLCLDDELPPVFFAEPNGATRLLRARIRLYATGEGDAALRRARVPGRGAKPAHALHLADRLRSSRRAGNKKRQARARMAAYKAARRLPVDAKAILFDSHMGKQFSDNPRAISDELARRGTGLRLTWDFLSPQRHETGDLAVIRRHTLAYAIAVARSKYIVDNQGLPSWVTKRPEQIHLQTWHGTPLKRMALHKLENMHPTPETVARITGEAAWDALVCPSDYFEATFVDAYRYTGHLIRGGSPRNDILIKQPAADPAFAARLDLPTDRTVVFYAPTFRENLRNRSQAATVLLDLDRWVEQFGHSHYLLLRPHYLNRFDIKREYAPHVMDVSHVEEISDLYRIADVMITDYSSAMFDYSWLDKPIVIYAPDYQKYAQDTRGTYFDLRAESPGPFCEKQAGLHEAIARIADQPTAHLDDLHRFRAKYCGTEDGQASARAVDYLLEVMAESQ